jgi:hypothetical protein
MTPIEFAEEFERVSGHRPTWGEFYYFQECSARGAPCSVHQADPAGTENPTWLRMTERGATLHTEDIRGQDSA